MRKFGFEPICDADSEILVLGSFPSVKSRSDGFYYGNKQNRFWKTLSTAFNEPLPDSIPQKIAILKQHKIALRDIVLSCEIKGSMDSQIKKPEIADIPKLILPTHIKSILCNGKTSYNLLSKHHPTLIPLAVYMPSTSPANTRFDEDFWLSHLRANN